MTYKDTPIKNPYELLSHLHLFLASTPELKSTLETKSQILKSLINNLDDTIQYFTSRVCIKCLHVCCINKHCYYELSDIIYICMIDDEIPQFKEDISDTQPCQFLSHNGCSLKRYKRPFRCNWYFCSDLIRFINTYGKKNGRFLSNTMQSIIDTRSEIIDIFFEHINNRQYANALINQVIRKSIY